MKKILLIVLALSLLLVVGCSDDDDNTLVWDTYSNGYYAFQYPAEWVITDEYIDESNTDHEVIIQPNKTSTFKFGIYGIYTETKDELRNEALYVIESSQEDGLTILNGQTDNPKEYKRRINNFLAYHFILEEESDSQLWKGELFLLHDEENQISMDIEFFGDANEYNSNSSVAKRIVESFEFLY
ncbi:hypothetical protein [Halonatronum saccharophilum]|uniref:hypothetical protein n=1 Tax=Halonatronum saccharophilum TaxID=150060 RepID=UPI00048A4314|nr:hypothetical protein [Halonatronum saccharophilum]